MKFQTFDNIPNDLLQLSLDETSVKIIIGENGTGKSSLLSKIARLYSRDGKKVIAIANSIHDKFYVSNSNFKALKASYGKKLVYKTIFESMLNLSDKDILSLRFTFRALGYVGFSERIGFKLKNFNPEYEFIIRQDTERIDPNDKEELAYMLSRFIATTLETKSDIVWVGDNKSTYFESFYADLIPIFKYSSILKKLKIFSDIEIFLSKERSAIPLLQASSGELSLLSSIVYIATAITDNNILLIDEPENSLHPRWQTDYINLFLDIFHYYNPQIFIATHSPLIINGAEANNISIKVYKSTKDNFILQNREPINVEEIYFKYFDVVTPQNRFLSQRIVEMLNALANEKMSIVEFDRIVADIKNNSYEEKQIGFLNSILQIANNI